MKGDFFLNQDLFDFPFFEKKHQELFGGKTKIFLSENFKLYVHFQLVK